MDIAAYPLAFLVLPAVIVAAYMLVDGTRTRMRVHRRLDLALGGRGLTDVETRLAEHSASVRSSVGRVAAMLGGLMPLGEDDREKIAASLRRAGFGSGQAVMAVLGAKTAALLVGLVAGLVVVPPMFSGLVGWGAGLVGGFMGGVLLNLVPEFVVARLAKARMRRIHDGLPDAFDLLIVSLESGVAFERALQRTIQDLRAFQPDLAAEFRQASFDMNVHGRSREEALGRLAGRLDSQEFRDFATTVAQSERHGTPLAEALRRFAASFRVAVITDMQEKAARLPILLILPTLLLVVPGMMVIVGGPAFLQMIESLGQFGN